MTQIRQTEQNQLFKQLQDAESFKELRFPVVEGFYKIKDDPLPKGPAQQQPDPQKNIPEPSVEKFMEFNKELKALIRTLPRTTKINGAQVVVDKNEIQLSENQLLDFNKRLSQLACKLLGSEIPAHPRDPLQQSVMVTEKMLEAGYYLDLDIGKLTLTDKFIITKICSGLLGEPKTYDTANLLDSLKKLGLDLQLKSSEHTYYVPNMEIQIFPTNSKGDTFGKVLFLPSGKSLVTIHPATLLNWNKVYKKFGVAFDDTAGCAEYESVLRNEFASDAIFKQLKEKHGDSSALLTQEIMLGSGRKSYVIAKIDEIDEAFSDLCSLSVEGTSFSGIYRILVSGEMPGYGISNHLMRAALRNPSEQLKKMLTEGDVPIQSPGNELDLESITTINLLVTRIAKEPAFRDAVMKDVTKVYVSMMRSFLKDK